MPDRTSEEGRRRLNEDEPDVEGHLLKQLNDDPGDERRPSRLNEDDEGEGEERRPSR
jgi:hypothetical protein